MTVANKTAVITGGGGGIGIAIAKVFAEAGAHIIIMDIDEAHCQMGAKAMAEAGLPAPKLLVPVNVGSPESVAEAFKAIDKAGLKVNFMLNVAGVREIQPIYDLDPADFMRVITINLGGTFFCAKEAGLRMRENGGGVIINIASVTGLMGEPARPAYGASKHAVIGLTKNLALDMGKDNIRVVALAPGLVRTPLTEPYYASQEFLNGLDELVPLGHAAGQAVDIGNAAKFLCSDDAAFVTGSCLVVDGGWSCCKSYAIGASTAFTSSKAGN